MSEIPSEMATSFSSRPMTSDPLRSGVERYFDYSLFAMIVTGFVTLAGTGKLDPLSIVFVLAALGLRAYHLATAQKLTLTVQTTTRLTIAYSFFYLLDFFFVSNNFITSTVHLVLFIMVVKMFSAERQRDDVYLAVISFMMILAAAILTVDSFFMMAFSLFLLLTVTTFVTMEMKRAYQKISATGDQESNGAQSLGVHSATARPTPTQRLMRSLSASAVVLVITIVGGSAAIFFILPRVSTGYLSAFAGRNAYVSGFGDNVQLGEIGRIQQSDAVVMHVQFPPGSLVPEDLKFRGVGLDQFDGRRWYTKSWAYPLRTQGINFRTSNMQARLTGLKTFPIPQPRQILNYRILMEPIGTNAFFLVQTPVTLVSDIRDYGIELNGTVTSADPSRQIRIYSGSSFIRHFEPQADLPSLEMAPAMLNNYLELPELDPRISKLAREITRDKVSSFDKASAIETYLQNNLGYTLEMYTAPGEDPLAYFLFTRKQGHCEYFASSMAVMLRTIGIPSRIVNGFRNGELNDVTGSYVVRARNAHSWVEAFIPGFGWATFDPTPAAAPSEVTGWSRTSLYIDAMREFWSEWVVNYDFNHQNNLTNTSIGMGRKLFDESRIWLRENYEQLLKKLRHSEREAVSAPRRFGGWAAALLTLIMVGVNLRRMLRALRNARLASKPARAPRTAATIWYEKMLRLLRRRGMEKTPSQTPAEFVSHISNQTVKSSVETFTEHYQRARFGDSSQDAERLPELFDEVEVALKK